MNGKQAKKLRRFARQIAEINPTKKIDEVYSQLKIIHNKKTTAQKDATYKKISQITSTIGK